mmetsp:Transcript_18755/g.27145  ORF Transcript_18755/g.27145 Transcript_18755/m.27145 type:complete len:104 (+) Transcript_18755:395-706(+)
METKMQLSVSLEDLIMLLCSSAKSGHFKDVSLSICDPRQYFIRLPWRQFLRKDQKNLLNKIFVCVFHAIISCGSGKRPNMWDTNIKKYFNFSISPVSNLSLSK